MSEIGIFFWVGAIISLLFLIYLLISQRSVQKPSS